MNKKILKNSLLGTTVLLLLLLTFPQVSIAEEEVPPLPMTVQGVAQIDGTPAPKGTVVAAYLNGEKVEEFLVNTSSGEYCFWISGTGEDEGKPVTFTVDGKDAEKSLTWKSGDQVISLELSVGNVSNVSSKNDSTSNTGSESLTGDKALGKNSEIEVIENSIPEPNLSDQKNMSSKSGDKETGESSEDSSKSKSTPGFQIVYAVTGIFLVFFRFNSWREPGRKP